jgi:hypothetical protein
MGIKRFREFLTEDLNDFIRRDFYHGTARKNDAFYPGKVAYLTPHKGLADKYAHMDAEVEGGKPRTLHTRVMVSKPVEIENHLMQDLHSHPDVVAHYQKLGHDSAVGKGNREEIAVFDPAHISIHKVEHL